MSLIYDKIYDDCKKLIKEYKTNNPMEILEGRGVILMPFTRKTKLLGMYKVIKRNRFVFFNPDLNPETLKMVLAHELGHDIYHRKFASKNDIIEYTLFNINSEVELEANLFASHLLLDDSDVISMVKQGYSYYQIANSLSVNVNLVIFKLNELQRKGYNININENPDRYFFKNISGKDNSNLDL